MFHMANDSRQFRTAEELRDQGYTLEGNVSVSRLDRYLPLYEAKMVHQFDHRWATYDAPERARNVTSDEKDDSAFVVQPRYWVTVEVVESALPQTEDGDRPGWLLGWRDICRPRSRGQIFVLRVWTATLVS